MEEDKLKDRRHFLALSAAGASFLAFGNLVVTTAQELPNPETLDSFLRQRLPPTEQSFREIFDAYLVYPEQKQYLVTLAQLEMEVDVYLDFINSVQKMPATFEKLAETLLLFKDSAEGQADEPRSDRAPVIRNAYQHYLINTSGPIPMRPSAADFDVFEWATEYAAGFSIGVKQAIGENGLPETLMTIDDPVTPVRFKAWGPVEGRSSAWALRDVGHLINYRRYGRHDVISSHLFSFDPQARNHSKANAIWLADIAQLVYMREAYVRRQLREWGYGQVRWIEGANDTQAVVAAHKDHVVVSFRGTESGKDFLTDLKFRKKPFYSAPGRTRSAGRVHRGFLSALDGAWHELLKNVNEIGANLPVFISGHSLGAALAQLAALRLDGHGKNVAGVYVYGSPRVGDAKFRDAYNAKLSKRTFLHINNEDIVTRVPPRWTGFEHVADSLRRFDAKHYISIDQSESDQPASLPRGEDADAMNRQLMDQAARTIRENQSYLQENDLTETDNTNLTYSANFEEGRLDDHGVSQYLFKFACAVVEEKMESQK